MRIQHNISALNAHRQLGANNSAVAKNLEKLSSGYAINRAADNAAGLAISEKMRGQIRGLDQAQANAQDGISLIQTAEGALNETHDILQRMRELSVQSANGTYQNDVDRENIQKEVDALKSEIDRISSSTHYNKINLLDGSLSANGSASSTTGAKNAANISLSDKAMNDGAWSVTKAEAGVYTSNNAVSSMADNSTNQYTFTFKDEDGVSQTVDISLSFDKANGKITGSNGSSTTATTGSATETANALKDALEKSDLGSKFKVAVTADNKMQFTAKAEGTAGASISSISQKTSGAASKITSTVDAATGQIKMDFSSIDVSKLKVGDTLKIGGKTITFTSDATNTTSGASNAAGSIKLSSVTDTASLVNELKTALGGAAGTLNPPEFNVGSGTPVASTGMVANGNTLTFTMPSSATANGGISTDQSVADTQLKNIMGEVEYSSLTASSTFDSRPVVNATAGTTAAGGGASFELDLSSIDISKIKVGDTLKIGDKTITFGTQTAVNTTTAGSINLGAVTTTANLATELATAMNGAFFNTGSGTSAATTVTANGSNIKIQASAPGAVAAADVQAAAEAISNGISGTTFETAKGGTVGKLINDPTNYTMTVTKQASDRYESVDFSGTKLQAWDASNADDKIEDHVVDIDGKKFLFVKDTTINNENLAKATAALGNDVNIVKTTTDTATANDVMLMADRIREKTGTNVEIDTTNRQQLNFKPTKGTSSTTESNGLTFQIGANGSADQRVSLSVEDMSSKGIGVEAISVSTQSAANKAITAVDNAINTVSRQRAGLGALQNRLEHTVNNLGTTSENLTSSEARIRDVDMAKEMVNMSKNNILTQAAQAMLAQANTQPQGVLQLLK